MKTAVMQRYSIISAGPGVDTYKDAIIGLWKNNLPNVPPERFNWLYAQNPGGPARSWLALAAAENEVVGIGSLYPRNVLVNGRAFRTGVAVDFAIDKNHRVLGPALMIQRAIISSSGEHGFPFTYAYPNMHSSPVFRHVGYRLMGKVRNCIKPLRIRGRVSEYIRIGFLARSAALLAEKYFWTMDRLHTAMLRFDLAGEVLSRSDERFDALWEELKSRYPVIGEKTSAFLNWRYAGSTTHLCSFFCLFTPDRKRLKGYITYTIKNDVAVVLDLFVDENGRLCEYLFLKFSERMRAENISLISLSFFGKEKFANRVRSLGFFTRWTRRGFFVFYNDRCGPGTVKTITNRENWLLFEGDMDL